jgi:hypothetical protein
MKFRAAVGFACLALSSPVWASQWIVTATGTALQAPTNPPGVTRIDVPQLQFQPVSFGLFIDSNVPLVVNPGPGGFGQFGTYQGAVSVFFLQVGPYIFERPAMVPTSFGVFNDLRTPTGIRQDQVSVSLGTGFAAGVALPPLLVDPLLGDDLFVSNFFFGRIATGTDDALPTLVDSVAFPDLSSIFILGLTNMSFQLRAGNPTTPAELAALPAAFFSVPLNSLFVTRVDVPGAIPEPGTWAMLIAGFGLVGATLRRQRRAAAAA